jgi:hypothetical protein
VTAGRRVAGEQRRKDEPGVSKRKAGSHVTDDIRHKVIVRFQARPSAHNVGSASVDSASSPMTGGRSARACVVWHVGTKRNPNSQCASGSRYGESPTLPNALTTKQHRYERSECGRNVPLTVAGVL